MDILESYRFFEALCKSSGKFGLFWNYLIGAEVEQVLLELRYNAIVRNFIKKDASIVCKIFVQSVSANAFDD